jgi:outer membrane biosynthesis protein TonB
MAHIISPYDRQNDYLESRLGFAVLMSVGFHMAAAFLLFFVFPHLIPDRQIKADEFITVELLGSLAPPAPAAPKAKVNPDLKGPDVVEAPTAPAPPSQPPAPAVPDVPDQAAAPQDVIPLGPKAPETPPEIKKTPAAPPKPVPPKVEDDKPKPKPKPQVNIDDAIEKRMKELERKTAADDDLDEAINSKMVNIAKSRGQGTGEGSESGGATSGQRIDPLKAAYYSHVRDIIMSNWTLPPGAMMNLRVVYTIVIEPDGRVSDAT